MSKFLKPAFILIFHLAAILYGLEASAAKCFRETDLQGFKSVFTIVVKGQIVERKKIKSKNEKYLLTIKPLQTIKGQLDQKVLTAEENHYGQNILNRQKYQIGDQFYFPVEKVSSNPDVYKTYLPEDGCPSLPIGASN